MSLFGSLLGGDDDDLFFGRQMRQMNCLMNSLMPDPFNMLTPFDNFGANHMRSPTSGGLFGFPGMNTNFNRLLNGDIPENNGAAFCSSSVIQMTSGPDGRPQIYQASSSTKTGPGGVRETRKTIQDSRTGLKKMAIGHHIGERGHIIEKEQNIRSGELNENQEFINLDEEEAEDFDKEFTTKVRGRRVLEITDVGHQNRHNHHRQLPALPAPPTSTPPSSGANNNTTTSSTSSDNSETTTTTATSANKTAEQIKISSTTSNSASNNLSTTQRRQLLSSRNLSKIDSRRPLRTPSSSPLASNTPSSSSSIHPHPYNVSSSARRNYRLKNHHHNERKNSNSQNNNNNNSNDN